MTHLLTVWIRGGTKNNFWPLIEEEVINAGIPLERVRVLDWPIGGDRCMMSDGERTWEGIRGDYLFLVGIKAVNAEEERI